MISLHSIFLIMIYFSYGGATISTLFKINVLLSYVECLQFYTILNYYEAVIPRNVDDVYWFDLPRSQTYLRMIEGSTIAYPKLVYYIIIK